MPSQLEHCHSELDVPDVGVAIRPRKVDPTAFFQHKRRHAVIFSARPGFEREFYPLAVDAYVHDAGAWGRPRTVVLGVHVDWLKPDGTIRRSIFLDPELDRLVEADWTRPLEPDSVHFLYLGRREQLLHRVWSGRFDCPQVNPYACAALADDKAATLAGWSGLGLETPRYRLLAPGDIAPASAFLDACPEAVIKPNRGTEGQSVFFCCRQVSIGEMSPASALDSCWQQGSALIQVRRDGVLYFDAEANQGRTLALRLNVILDGCRHRVGSGYAQIGASADFPASCGRGGHIITLNRALASLATRHDSTRSVAAPSANWWNELTRQAEIAAGWFGHLGLVGLDVLLDLDDQGRLLPVFLEANARPAGLGRSRLLSGLPTPSNQPGVGTSLWAGLDARLEPCCSIIDRMSLPPDMTG